MNFGAEEIIFVCDMGGVLADSSHRKKYQVRKDYKKFYSNEEVAKDDPIELGIALANTISKSADYTIILTARNERCEKATKEWLDKNGVKYDEVLFRGLTEWVSASEYKKAEVEKLLQFKDEGTKIFYIDDSYENVRNVCNISSNIAGMTFKVIDKEKKDACQTWII